MSTTPRANVRRNDSTPRDLRTPQGRPLLLTGSTVITGDPLLGDWQEAVVLIGGTVIVGIGPGLLTAAGDDNMIVIDCAGTLALPATADFTTPHADATLTPGKQADIAVLRLADTPGTPAGAAPARGTHLDILVTGGQVRLYNGRPLNAADATTTPTPEGVPDHDPSHPFLGMWVDDNDFVRQELLPDGRYDEARADRPSAYQGRYWITGTRIDYLDDLGFWAYGEFRDGHLHHAGYRFTRR
ncbi:Atu4866 domain-containing protein [Streptomyces arboris]|uniref:Amidohydrolase n=1 Tax=Streptomyces arboris TaxID=2600619 RepID=A0A5N5EE56_9ACTN|nr:Atu4866 domain-containing protein [Streptomyces arboris]KAB2588313.1 amidohydrolase [Streptomyces arboris]